MRAKMCSVIIICSAFAPLLSACQPASPKTGIEVSIDKSVYYAVSAQELQTMLMNKDFTMINVHIPWQGDIPQTDLRLAFDQISDNQEQLPADKDDKILIYCLTSGMAKIAVQSLMELGYTNIWMLEGGTTAWEDAGLLVTKE